MNNEEKARMYHTLLLRHDKLDGLISDIKSEAAGVELNLDQKIMTTNLLTFKYLKLLKVQNKTKIQV